MLTQSLEDYLEAITILEKKHGNARIRDIGKLLKVKNPSVVSAINILADSGYVSHEKYSYVELTRKGEKAAEKIHRKHRVIIKFLKDVLKVPAVIAKNDACKIEHVISEETYAKILSAVEKPKK